MPWCERRWCRCGRGGSRWAGENGEGVAEGAGDGVNGEAAGAGAAGGAPERLAVAWLVLVPA